MKWTIETRKGVSYIKSGDTEIGIAYGREAEKIVAAHNKEFELSTVKTECDLGFGGSFP